MAVLSSKAARSQRKHWKCCDTIFKNLKCRPLSPFQSLLWSGFDVVLMFTKRGYMKVKQDYTFKIWILRIYLFNPGHLNSLVISNAIQAKTSDRKPVLRDSCFCFSCWTQLVLRFSQQRFNQGSVEIFVFNFYTKFPTFYYRTGWRFLNFTNRSSLNMALSSFQTQTHQQMKTTTLIAK